MTGYTLPDGTRAPDAPPLWPFGVITPELTPTPMPEPRHAPARGLRAPFPTDAEPAPF